MKKTPEEILTPEQWFNREYPIGINLDKYNKNSPVWDDIKILLYSNYYKSAILNQSIPNDGVLKVAVVRDLLEQMYQEKISFSRFVEILNELKVKASIPSEEEIDHIAMAKYPAKNYSGNQAYVYREGFKDAIEHLTKGR